VIVTDLFLKKKHQKTRRKLWFFKVEHLSGSPSPFQLLKLSVVSGVTQEMMILNDEVMPPRSLSCKSDPISSWVLTCCFSSLPNKLF